MSSSVLAISTSQVAGDRFSAEGELYLANERKV
jgi:hypothetical protein